MINSLEFVEEQGYAEVPEADAEYDVATATDPEGPGDIPSGDVTIKVTNTGDPGIDVGLVQPEEVRRSTTSTPSSPRCWRARALRRRASPGERRAGLGR